MSTASNDENRSGGANISGGTVNTGGGDVFGGDKFGRGNYPELGRDRAEEDIVKLLRIQLETKETEIAVLRNENKELHHRVSGIDAVFDIVKMFIGDHSLSTNEYIVYSCIFLKDKKLQEDFQRYLPIDARKAVKKHD